MIEAADLELTRDSCRLSGYAAHPKTDEARGGVVLVHEAFGLVDHIRDVATRLAAAGFDVLAPDLYTRTGAPHPADLDSVMKKTRSLRDSAIVDDLATCAGHLRGLRHSNSRVGCLGFCAGGRAALLFACSTDRLDACVDCWGGNITQAEPGVAVSVTRPVPVIDLVGNLRCPVFIVGGEEDHNPSPVVLRELEARLLAKGKDFRIEIFSGAGHAFFADYRPNYRHEAAAVLWEMLVSYLHEHLDA